MEDGKSLMRRKPAALWRDVVFDITFGMSWAMCVGISYGFIQVVTDRPAVVCAAAALPLGCLLFWLAMFFVQIWCDIAENQAEDRI
jgi:hypothetical protein